jgi:hypothetical protein
VCARRIPLAVGKQRRTDPGKLQRGREIAAARRVRPSVMNRPLTNLVGVAQNCDQVVDRITATFRRVQRLRASYGLPGFS